MDEEQKDVKVDPSATDDTTGVDTQVTPEPDTQGDSVPEGADAVTSTEDVKPQVRDTRPIENVAWETKRKLDEVVPSLQKEIHDLKDFIQTNVQPQQPKYSKAQLQAFASEPNTPTEQRLWAYTEVEKIEKDERRREYENLVKTTTDKTTGDQKRNQSAQWVAQNLPDTIAKDANGNFAGWNRSHPILQRAEMYIANNEALRNDPEGFMAACKMAAFDLGVSPSQAMKNNRTVAQLRKEQKKQLASAGGTRPAENAEQMAKTKYIKLSNQYKTMGNGPDKEAVFAEMIKMRGLNPFA